MTTIPLPKTRLLTIIGQDPSIKDPYSPAGERILRARIAVPAEELQPGPWGYRVQVIDTDISAAAQYTPCLLDADQDPFAKSKDSELLRNPHFHCQNVYALVMRTLARFEFALGRRVSWGFYGHHLNVVPHAFADANAFYSPDDHALLFGYFTARDGTTVYTCLSHDVVVHETTHALLDGLRERYTDPSSPDQAAFHEGFADVVALLSMFSLPDVAGRIIDLARPRGQRPDLIPRTALTREALRSGGLLRLAEELGGELSVVRGAALRHSVAELHPPSPFFYVRSEEFREAHRRGEILVAAVLNTFIDAWYARLDDLDPLETGQLSRERVVEEGATIADSLLTLVVRALDYTPPVHITFGDFLSAALTSDAEVRADDSKYHLRELLYASFGAFGIAPASARTGAGVGLWESAPAGLAYERTHFEAMRSDPDEVFRFVWENRGALELCDEAFSRVLSVRPSVRVAPDGFVLHEVVVEYLQILTMLASELSAYRIRRPKGMEDDEDVTLYGGGTLIFDEYGHLKYHIHNSLTHAERQSERLQSLWDHGAFRKGASVTRQFSQLHRQRAAGGTQQTVEEW